VLDICRRLDGIALALELAAARVPLLGVEGVRARLDERFNVLTGGARTAMPRHQTLRAAFDWSHGLLSEGERTVFRRLAAFVGSFSLEAAQQVVRDATMDVWEVLDHLAALVDKSLVAVDQSDVPRYRLLETGRAYALEQLAYSGETNAIAHRHAQTFAALFESSYAKRWQARPAEHLACYRPELDNLRAALDWASRNDLDLEIGLAGAAAWLWRDCGLHAEGIAACELAIAHVRSTTAAALEARVLSELVQTGRLRLPLGSTLRALERAIALYQTLDDRVGLYLAVTRSVPFLALAGDTDETQRALATVQALEDPSWPPLLRIQRLQALETVLCLTGPAEELRATAEQRLHFAYLAESTLDELSARAGLVFADTMLGRLDESIRGGRELIEQFRRSGFAAHLGSPLADLALALSLKGELDDAVRLMREAVPLLKQQADVLFVLDRIALIAFLRGRTDSAARLFGAGNALFEKLAHKRFFDEQRVHDDVFERLNRAFAPDELARLMRQGEAMSENEAIALGLRQLE
jgi:tetratricopeptide (TPR) repeat protein